MERLRERGFVYEKDGSVYFSIAKYERYGRLSRLDTREIKSGLRYDTDEYEKDDVRDFALWKATAPNEPSWDTPFGPGRPGWHIECSAMVRKIFGGTIDIHTGGVDLIFPHHENEIAQSECAYGEPFVRHWIHVEHLLVEGKKMSKSLGNFYTLRDLLEKGHSPRSIRYLLISAHYRKQLNFTFDGLRQADAALDRIDNLIVRLGDAKGDGPVAAEVSGAIDSFLAKFAATVDDDLNISAALAAVFEFVRETNKLIDDGCLGAPGAAHALALLDRLDAVCALFPAKEPDAVPQDVLELVNERQRARREKNFARADEIRDTLKAMGWVVEDTADGPRVKTA